MWAVGWVLALGKVTKQSLDFRHGHGVIGFDGLLAGNVGDG